MDAGTALLIIIGGILLIALLLLFGGGVAMGEMAMMAGMMSTPIGWIILLVIMAVIGLLTYTAFFA